MNLTKAQRVRLGLFVAIGAFLVAVSMVFVLGLRLFSPVDVYTVAYPGNVSGLEEGAEVRYQGLRVGSVQALEVAPDEDVSAILIRLALEPDTVLHEGTEAVLEFSGITGLKTVNLVPGDPRNPVLAPGSRIPPGSSFIERISGEAEAIAAKVERLANNLLGFTSPVNRRRFEDLLVHLVGMSRTADEWLAQAREPARKAIESLTDTSRSVREASEEVTESVRRLRRDAQRALRAATGALKEAERVLAAVDGERVRSIVTRTDAIATRIDEELSRSELAETLQQTRVALARLTQMLDEVDLVVRAGRQDLLLSLRAIRESTEHLREFTQLISRDPSLLLRGAEIGN